MIYLSIKTAPLILSVIRSLVVNFNEETKLNFFARVAFIY